VITVSLRLGTLASANGGREDTKRRAITIAVLGGVAITGGIGRVSGIVLATVLIVWMNAGIRLAFEGNASPQYQLLALGVLLVFAALLNGFALRRYGGVGSQEVASGCHR
jgi:ribose/xylose/arabinose/galactoside ABC-type transport system permease subunit